MGEETNSNKPADILTHEVGNEAIGAPRQVESWL